MPKCARARCDLPEKSSDKSLVTFQSLSSCCSVDPYFSRLEVTGRGTDTCELEKDFNPCPKIMVPSKDWPCKQLLTLLLRPRLASLSPSPHLFPYFCHKSSLLFRDHLRRSYSVFPVSWGFPLSPSAHTREAQVVWKCSLGQISILMSLLPPKLLR